VAADNDNPVPSSLVAPPTLYTGLCYTSTFTDVTTTAPSVQLVSGIVGQLFSEGALSTVVVDETSVNVPYVFNAVYQGSGNVADGDGNDPGDSSYNWRASPMMANNCYRSWH
jgi:hypothetical protein